VRPAPPPSGESRSLLVNPLENPLPSFVVRDVAGMSRSLHEGGGGDGDGDGEISSLSGIGIEKGIFISRRRWDLSAGVW
jgi:hypothetical protein